MGSEMCIRDSRDLGLVDVDEPFNELLCQGMVNKAAPFCQPCGVTLPTVYEGQSCPHCESDLGSRSAKMSKSLGNTVSPEDMIDRYGADTVRLFILFAANPTAGMDWSDAALDANHRVMVQLRSMPEQLMAWPEVASPLDGWLEARFAQRAHEFSQAMDAYDLRRAVEISHYEIIKDINWYTRRGGQNVDVARRWLPTWAQMVSVSTPHLAEEWWAAMEGTSGLVAGSTMTVPDQLSDDQQTLLDGEQYIRDVLEQARKVRVVAERHLGQPASEATFVVSPSWKRTMAQAALSFIQDGGHPKQFIPILQELPMAQGERKGEMLGFWGKKMLPQVFKWDDASKGVVASTLDEVAVLAAARAFIADELQLASVHVVLGEGEDDDTGRAGSAMPLSPAVVYA